MIGLVLRNYEVLRKIGRGAMGVVYLARDFKLERVVALKFLPPGTCRDAAAKQRLLNEARAASALDHDNICTIHDIDEVDGQVFIVMPFYQGQTLAERLRQGALPIGEVVHVIYQIADAMAYAHQHGVVHRDLKPSNLMLLPDGRVKILDFGIATTPGSEEGPGRLVGTPFYMSPEQARGESVDERADVWAAGVILYEMLSGRRPFAGPSTAETIHAILHHRADSVPPPPGAAAGLAAVADRALTRSLADRYPCFVELRDDLAALALPRQGPELWQKPFSSVPTHSIAVLPFDDLSPAGDQAYFCDGMSDEIIGALSRLDGLRVVGRTSSFAFRGARQTAQEIGRELDVATVLEGSVRTAPGRLRIRASLIDVGDGIELWSQSFDRGDQDLFAIQDQIAAAIAATLEDALVADRPASLIKRERGDVEAYRLYLRGLYHWNRRELGAVTKSIDFFERAIESDPEFALAYAAVADAFNVLGFYGHLPPERSFDAARISAEKALQLDPACGEAHNALAFVDLYHRWDFAAAGAGFERALELRPGHATARHWYAEYLVLIGRIAEARVVANRSLAGEPLNLILNTLIGWVHYYARDFGEAIETLTAVLDLDHRFEPARYWLALAYRASRRPELAETVLAPAVELSDGDPRLELAYAGVLADLGSVDRARALLEGLIARASERYISPYLIADLFLALGDEDGALSWLSEGLERRDAWMVFLHIDPAWDRLRGRRAFAELVDRVGVPVPRPATAEDAGATLTVA